MSDCLTEKDCYITTMLTVYIIGIVILIGIYIAFLKNQVQLILLSDKRSNESNILSNCSFVASLSIFFSIIYEILVLIRGVIFWHEDLKESNTVDVFIILAPMFYAAAKGIGFYYVLRSTQLAYTTIAVPKSSSRGSDCDSNALDFPCLCCTIYNGTKWSSNGVSEFTIDQMSYICVYFLLQCADAFGGGGKNGLYLGNDYNDFFRAIAVLLEYLYLIFLIIMIFQRYCFGGRRNKYSKNNLIRRITAANGFFVIVALIISITQAVLEGDSENKDYNGVMPNNERYFAIDITSLIGNILMALTISAGYVDPISKLFCCCGTGNDKQN